MTAPIANTMLASHPRGAGPLPQDLLVECLAKLDECAEACTVCADACLAEPNPADLATCIRLDMDCADVCATTARVLARNTGFNAAVSRSLLTACMQVCTSCAEECERHAPTHEHCRICAEACRRCADACTALARHVP
ncbi:four-helix bundle copper-binding protein [Allostreptomyces psammosilenae]|uniref:Four-helix bundle copper-binding protein n=1 Tax=Allostreptomyces psammosilenae TaxID=1892865 RepID=A0A853A136_9ACTN|nr:four-helix bundle copper-binding protein [Allostreptomyces psammosilenae]NYI04118.1 hypothetical protein [Allostreptomyces psammosilenae]